MAPKIQLSILGECAFTFYVVKECIEQEICGVATLEVVIFDNPYEIWPSLECIERASCKLWHEYYFYHCGWRQELEELCEKNRISLITTKEPFIYHYGGDILITAGFSLKVPNYILSRFGKYALNIHPSLLPAFKGPQPEAQVILAGCKQSGVSIHTMVNKWDAGAIWFQKKFQVPDDATVGSLEQIEARIAADGIKGILCNDEFMNQEINPHYYPKYFHSYPHDTLCLDKICSVELALRVIRLWPEGVLYLTEDGFDKFILKAAAYYAAGSKKYMLTRDPLFLIEYVASAESPCAKI